MEQERKIELDLLRLLAMLAVITIHVCSRAIAFPDIHTPVGILVACFTSAITWSVPVFVMISGSLFLDKDREFPLSKLFRKYIPHLVVCFFFWSGIYHIWYRFTGVYDELNWKGMLSQFLQGPTHLWYIVMLIGLYILIPFLRKIAEDDRLTLYFIVLSFISFFVVQYLVELPGLGATVEALLHTSGFHFTLGFTGYYLMGHYLYTHEISGRQEMAIYSLGLLALVFTCGASVCQSLHPGDHYIEFIKYCTPNVMLEAAALFLLFTKRISKIHFSQKAIHVLTFTTNMGLGIYLIHALIIDFFIQAGSKSLSLSPLLLIPLLTTSVFVFSLLGTWLIKKIPFLGKHIV